MKLKKKWKRVLLVSLVLLVNKTNYSTQTTINYDRKELIGTRNIVEVKEEVKDYLDYRMTYYYTGDNTNSTNITASGLKTSDFQINDKGWYTYKGKLVVATAHKSLFKWEKYKNSTQKTFNLYEEIKIEIKGVMYDAIVIDKCGQCCIDTKIDLFVKDRASGFDGQIKVYID